MEWTDEKYFNNNEMYRVAKIKPRHLSMKFYIFLSHMNYVVRRALV